MKTAFCLQQHIMVEETPRIMYLNKTPDEDVDIITEDDKSSLTLLHPIHFESTENVESAPCCKYERGIPSGRSRNYESERGKLSCTYLPTEKTELGLLNEQHLIPVRDIYRLQKISLRSRTHENAGYESSIRSVAGTTSTMQTYGKETV